MKRSLDSRVDYSLLLPVFFLLVIGVVAIYIAVSHDYPNNILPILGQQVAWIALGLVIGFVVMLFNTEFLWKVTPFLYILGLGLMILPIVFYNPSLVASTGAKNWVSINGITLFQPSEFMKISYILMLARVIVQFTKKHKEWRRTVPLDFLLIFWMILFTIPVLVLLALQSDLGTALVFVAIFSGIVGQGFNASNLLIPVRESDMIFTVIAEDFGFIGSVLVIALYLMLIYRMLKITLKSNNQFYTYISTGLIMMLLFHIFENIGAVTGLLPLTGIPLPFISQGGSAIISNLIGVGLLLSMSYQTNLAEEKSGKVPFKRKKVVLKQIK
ncbi:RodA [Streptococcus pneumoniae]|uniref:FtsW/RodA/SpoVE family cell cycle protein n=1 Tax=Streptococcus pneumoniae TaxID=1313 RepID=UPI00076963B7|nr:FtsW/RodA/SpoVE family cell cycle protein [Streptococcus pneumoniae]CXG40587.1 RodA [Streptococcus pneumoniae]